MLLSHVPAHDDDDDDDDADDDGDDDEEGGGRRREGERKEERGAPSLQNEHPTPQDDWEKNSTRNV